MASHIHTRRQWISALSCGWMWMQTRVGGDKVENKISWNKTLRTFNFKSHALVKLYIFVDTVLSRLLFPVYTCIISTVCFILSFVCSVGRSFARSLVRSFVHFSLNRYYHHHLYCAYMAHIFSPIFYRFFVHLFPFFAHQMHLLFSVCRRRRRCCFYIKIIFICGRGEKHPVCCLVSCLFSFYIISFSPSSSSFYSSS